MTAFLLSFKYYNGTRSKNDKVNLIDEKCSFNISVVIVLTIPQNTWCWRNLTSNLSCYEQPIFYSRGWTVSQSVSAAKAGNLHSQEKSGLRSDLQQPLCALSRQEKAHTYADSCWFGDLLLSLTNQCPGPSAAVFSVPLLSAHLPAHSPSETPCEPISLLFLNHRCSFPCSQLSSSVPVSLTGPWGVLISSNLNQRYQWKKNSVADCANYAIENATK